MKYIDRILERAVSKYLKIFPVVGITGPRQSGKSTLLKHLLQDDYKYVTFDDYKMVELFHDDPEKFMKIYTDKIIFDEAQKVPEIFNYIKIAVDNDRQNYGKFILSGSGQFAFMKTLAESLAGRIGLLSLLPFQYSEIPGKLQDEAIIKGAYPELVNRGFKYTDDWYSSYIETYLNKDVYDFATIGNLRDFRRLISMLAANTSQIFNMSGFSNDLGVAVSTIKRWVSVLEASYIIFLLPPFYNNFGKRVIKSPKIYFYDTGLVSFLTGVENKSLYEKGPMAGSIFENYIVSEILKCEIHKKTMANLYYYRTSHGVEIDLIVDRNNRKEFIEIKKSSTFRPRMVKHLEDYIGNQDRGYLIYEGDSMPYSDNVKVLCYKEYLD